MNDYAHKIKSLCNSENITIKDLVKKIGMSVSGFYSALNNNSLKIQTLEKIASHLGVSINYFFNDNFKEHYYSIEIEDFDNLRNLIENNALKGKGLVYLQWDFINGKFNKEFKELKKPLNIEELKEFDKKHIREDIEKGIEGDKAWTPTIPIEKKTKRKSN
jgi:transcriptional regulator with XRE-family HTH domain